VSIVLDNVAKAFDGKTVLDGFSLVIKDGETVCIMGPSGCGKTTLFNIMLGLIKPDGGSVSGMPERAAAVFQEPRLCEDFSLISNVKIAAKKDVAPAEIAAGLEALGLSEFAGKKVRVLSGGQKQRAAILRAVLSGCGVVLMDEPFKGLDEGTKEKTMDFVKKAVAGKTCLIITHDRKEADFFSGRIVNMS
jgi:NitT/TauT family transport system ATP-binding protein